MSRRPKRNPDTYCGCKVCDYIHRLKSEWYCKVCKVWRERGHPERQAQIVKEHQQSRAHVHTVERHYIESLYGGTLYRTTRIHTCGVPTERIEARGFDYFSTIFNAWYGHPDGGFAAIDRCLGKYLNGDRCVVIWPVLFNSDDAWNAALVMAEHENADTLEQDAGDMWMDFYLKVKRGEYT